MSLIVTLSHALFKGVQLQWPAIMSHDYTHYGLSATQRTGLNDRSNIPNQTLSKKVSPLDFEHIHWAIHLRLKPIWVLIKMKDRFFCFSFWGCICLKWKIWYLILIVGQFGTGQFGTKIIKRTIWHQEKNEIQIIV